MRPLRLAMTAFGPYGGEQTLDFAELAGRSFFLIHGPTGAGKTSVLDAMCFALYGDTSGAERTGAEMRSRFAADDTETAVTFEFALGEETYRVRRTPAQEALGRGGKLVKRNPEAELWRTDAEERLLASGVRDVGERVKDLLGFSSDQFRQVVMLPQGRFRELLSADTRRREEILRQLFRTDAYGAIEERLKSARNELATQLGGLRTRADEVLRGVDADSVEALDEAIEVAERRAAEAQEAETQAATVAVRASEALRVGEQAQRVLGELAEATSEEAALGSRADEMASRSMRLEQAQRAAAVAPQCERVSERERERAQRHADHEAAKTELAVAEATLDRARRNKEAQDELRAERDAVEATARELREVLARLDGLRQASREVHAAQQRLRAADGAIEGLRALAEIHDLRAAADEATRFVQGARELAELGRQAQHAATALDEAQEARELAERQLSEAREALRLLEDRWRSGQAAVLARGLVEGEACPVCGSQHHPLPAAEAEVPTERAIEDAKEGVTRAEARLRDAGDLLSTRREERAAAELRVAGKREAFGDCELADAEERLADLDGRRASAEAKAAACGGHDELCRRVAGGSLDLESAVQQAAAHREEALSQLASATATRDERAAGVPEQYREGESLAVEVVRAERQAAEMRQAATEAEEAVVNAGQVHAAVLSKSEASEKALALAEQAARDAREAFVTARTEAGFADEEAFRAAQLPVIEMRALEAGIREHERALEAARSRLERARESAAEVQPVDIESLREAARRASEQRDEATRACETARNALVTLATARARHGAIMSEQSELNERYGLVARLADVACGRNPMSLSFQTYVLGTYLDEVLRSATRRLAAMSRGRYRLYRKLDGGDRRKAAGLDLEVFDEYTGDRRPVSTLSGGEGFLASLALALGLAEVVQSFAGGTKLETIFVDEGFGTLDEETLDEAIKTLMELQERGRLVGIISHVPELRQLIDCRLEVTQTQQGSTARFVVG